MGALERDVWLGQDSLLLNITMVLGSVLQVAATASRANMHHNVRLHFYFLFRIWSDFEGIPTLVTHISEPGPFQSTSGKDLLGVTA